MHCQFQSRSPSERRRPAGSSLTGRIRASFNPRSPPKRRRVTRRRLGTSRFNPAPLRKESGRAWLSRWPPTVSIHAPLRKATLASGLQWGKKTGFNPRSPPKRRPTAATRVHREVSIHAPLERRATRRPRNPSAGFQSRSPPKGGDRLDPVTMRPRQPCFNPRSSERATLAEKSATSGVWSFQSRSPPKGGDSRDSVRTAVSIHAPLERRRQLSDETMGTFCVGFNPAPLRKESDLGAVRIMRNGFNPRSPPEKESDRTDGQRSNGVSIPAPLRKEATADRILPTIASYKCFNPRSLRKRGGCGVMKRWTARFNPAPKGGDPRYVARPG